MDTKLTLKLDKNVIDKAKAYAASHKRSLSGIVEAYLITLIERNKTQPEDDIEISPFVKSLRTGVKVPSNIDCKQVYGDYLAEKYK
ncbi:MAG: hypothetical protein JJU28_07645 [Cyclobacteriaceae bacterium]|nr:hypothetical protein [Cyclobacteriaceae bacterium]